MKQTDEPSSLNLSPIGAKNLTTDSNNCGVKGNNTYQIVYSGNSDLAMDGAGVRAG